MSWLVLMLACGGAEPELVAQRDAIAAWRDGVQAMEDGRYGEADARFAAARALRPRDGLLLGWQASAAAKSGELDRAIDLAGEALEAHPQMGEIRYDRAAWLARAGRVAEAGPELARALADGAASPEVALDDPDFASHLDQPAFAFLPRAAPEAQLAVPEGAVFWGSQAEIALSVQGRGEIEVQGGMRGPVELVGAIARQRGTGASTEATQVWSAVVRGAGEVVVGPLTVRVGGRVVEVPEARFQTLAPPDRPASEDRVVALSWVTSLAKGQRPPSAVGGAGELRVVATHQQKVAIQPVAGRRQKFDGWREGEPELRIHRWVGVPAGRYTAVVREGTREVLRSEVEVTAGPQPPG